MRDDWIVNRFAHVKNKQGFTGGRHMFTGEFSILTDTGAILGESPVWCARTGTVWWVDIDGRQLLNTNHADGKTQSWETPEMAGFVVLTEAGQPAVGMETGIFLFDRHTGHFDRIVHLSTPGTRFNDATTDADGRLWAATMDLDAGRDIGTLYAIGPNLDPDPVVHGMRIPNGLAHDASRNRLYLSDSYPDVQTIWTMECTGGAVGPRRHFASLKEHDGRPDGAALDTAGNYWIAGVSGGVIHVFDPAGTHIQEIASPFGEPTKLAFAGPEMNAFYLTSKGGMKRDNALALWRGTTDSTVRGVTVPPWRISAHPSTDTA